MTMPIEYYTDQYDLSDDEITNEQFDDELMELIEEMSDA